MNKKLICIILTAIMLFGTIQIPVTVSAEPTESATIANDLDIDMKGRE